RLVDQLSEGRLTSYRAWLQYEQIENRDYVPEIKPLVKRVTLDLNFDEIIDSALTEWQTGLSSMLQLHASVSKSSGEVTDGLILKLTQDDQKEAYSITGTNNKLILAGGSSRAILYGIFHLLRLIQQRAP